MPLVSLPDSHTGRRRKDTEPKDSRQYPTDHLNYRSRRTGNTETRGSRTSASILSTMLHVHGYTTFEEILRRRGRDHPQ